MDVRTQVIAKTVTSLMQHMLNCSEWWDFMDYVDWDAIDCDVPDDLLQEDIDALLESEPLQEIMRKTNDFFDREMTRQSEDFETMVRNIH
jgi:hypothetical protein